ncbi:MAG TPA: SPOR domain-containing protein [Hyphomicrobiaceae bacterium]|nr:SPOR domain-containing protein [Hyphomicrobiaceae bacterium]
MAVWAVLATAALAYLAVFVHRPDLIHRFAVRPQRDGVELQRLVERMASENAALRGEMKGLKADLDDLRSVVAERQARDQAIADRMAAMSPPPSGASAEKGVTTGAIGPAVLAVSPAPAAPAAEPKALQLTTASSLEALRLAWSLLTDQNKALFRGLEPRYVEVEGGGSYQLLAGPLKADADALKACNTLKQRRLPCSVVPFRGAAL